MKNTNRKPQFLNRKNLLTAKENAEYERQRMLPERRRLLNQIETGRRQSKINAREERYNNSGSGRFAKKTTGFLRGFQSVARRGVARSLYERNTTPYTRPYQQPNQQQNYGRRTGASSGGGRGRPSGTYDQRYAAYGGVYGYRKAMAQQRWKERQQILQNSVTNLRQRQILNQINQRDEYQRRSPESQTFPDTDGHVGTRSIMDEINDACNAVA